MKITTENIRVNFQAKEILKGISIETRDKELVGIIGPNGSGKSTLLKCIYRVLKADSGAVYLDGEELYAMNAKSSAKKMAVVAQHNYYNFDFSAREVVLMGRAPHKKTLERDNADDYRIVEEALKIVQKQRGWVPDGAIHAIADVLGIPASDVEGVATFYSQIFRQPVGRHVIRYCDSVVCHINGYQGIQAALEKKLNIKPGQTTFDGRFTLLPTCCLGNCDKGPNMMIDEDTHAHLTPEAIPELLERYK